MKIKTLSGWDEVVKACKTTSSKFFTGEIMLTPEWKRRILISEHSPIRNLIFSWTFENIPYWVSVHLSRHKIGIEHFVSSSRTDKTGVDRDKLPQDHPVNHRCVANAQAIINISRKRLCANTCDDTRSTWLFFLGYLYDIEPELFDLCHSECVYRGFCPEMRSCGYFKTKDYNLVIKEYRKGINGNE